MHRHKAWILAAIITASVVSLTLGVGASLGYFGFGSANPAAASASVTAEQQYTGSTVLSYRGEDYDDDDDDEDDRLDERRLYREKEHKDRSGEYGRYERYEPDDD